MALTLEIEHLMGVAFAAVGPDSDQPDWPPQPDRVFSALTAAWGSRGHRPEERAALEWLERQEPPMIAASAFTVRPAPTVYVPPNDPQSSKKNADSRVMPLLRPRYPRRFPAALPFDPVARLAWSAEPDDAVFAALGRLAGDVGYVGHSASLTRCRFFRAAVPEAARPASRRVYRGRLAELEAGYKARPLRRPSPGASIPAVATSRRPPESSVFDPDWLVLAFASDSPSLDLRAAPLACKALLKAVMAGFGAIGAAIPPAVSGHNPDGTRTADPHLAAVPMAFAGWPHADGAIKGLALVPPRGSGLLDGDTFLRALRAITVPAEELGGGRILSLWGTGLVIRELAPVAQPPADGNATGAERPRLKLVTQDDPEQASLNPARYGRASSLWATVTPIVLDRHLDPIRAADRGAGERRQREIADLVQAACRNVGIAQPVKVVPGKHAAIEGAPSALPSGNAPGWTRWSTPPALASRALTHAVLRFAEPVAGPLILGAGRFCGLGLCLPLDTEPRR